MKNKPNVILRGGPADGQIPTFLPPGELMPFEDVGGGSVTYVDVDQIEYRDGMPPRVYKPSN